MKHPLSWLTQFWRDLPLGIKGIFVIALPLAVLLFSLGFLYVREQESSQLENKLRLALENQRDIQTVHTQLLEASTGVRDYLLTGDKNFLKIFIQAEQVLPRLLIQLESQLENQEQKQRLASITPLVMQNLQNLNALAKNESDVASPDLIHQFRLQVKSLDTLRKEIERLNADEAVLVANDQQDVISQRQRNIKLTLIAAAAGIIGSLMAVWVFSLTIVQRVRLLRDSAAHLAKAEALDLPSSSRDELGQLSNELDHASQLLSKNIQVAMQARQEAEQASAAKSMFLSRTSHELRTPLNAILGFAQLLEEDLQPGKQRDSVSLIKGAGQHLLKLINEVLEIARIESGEMTLALEPIIISDLLEEAQHYIAPMGKIRDIQIVLTCQQTVCALANRQKLLQVVLNLLSNALKYGPDSASVYLRAYQNEHHVYIEVEDEGKGVPPEVKERLFTPFDRLGAEHSKVEGTGLGLALSKQLMQAMQGNIVVANDKSLFTLSLPVASISSVRSNTQPNISPQVYVANANRQSILYVEDNPSNKALVQAIIQRQSHLKIDCVSTIKEAQHYLREVTPALILLDLHLPDGSGELLVNQLKSSPNHQHIPIMILSADALPETIQRLQNCGVDYYLTKPLDVAMFNKHIKELLSSSKASQLKV